MDYEVHTYKCPECDWEGPAHELDNDGGMDDFCPECGGHEVEYDRSRKSEWCQVAVYELDRAYGGPEEGGWWYDTGCRVECTVRSFERCDFPQVRDYFELLRRRYGKEYAVHVFQEKTAPGYFPKAKPYYC